jgi:diguanylate cyclase (GGDEF)-like protein
MLYLMMGFYWLLAYLGKLLQVDMTNQKALHLQSENENLSKENDYLRQEIERLCQESFNLKIAYLYNENQRLIQENDRLQQETIDLKISLSTIAEHGDLVEAQLEAEVQERRRSEMTVKAMAELLASQIKDLEIIIQTIMEHGDVLDIQWFEKVNQANQAAWIDGLTEIANRRRFDDFFQQQWKQMARERSPISIIMCDIDFFKQYNDTYGHLAGDECLRRVAQTLNCSIKRPIDLIARYGGEEFAAVLPQTDLEGAENVAKQLQVGVQALNIPHSTSRVSSQITLSIGVACTVPSATRSHTELIDSADQQLYQAKQRGRNRIERIVIS